MATSFISGLGGTSGFGENILPVGHGNSSAAIDITSVFGAQGLNFFGRSYSVLYVNTDGTVTFDGPLSTGSPSAITAATNTPIIAAFWADVDTRGATVTATPGGASTGSGRVYYDLDAPNGVVTVTWDDVGYYDRHSDKSNAFQIQLVSFGNGDFDIVLRYEAINWTTGDASGGSGGLGGKVAVAGYSNGDGVHFSQLSQSGNQAGMLSLPTASNMGVSGVFVFESRAPTGTVTVAHDDAYIAAKDTALHIDATSGVLFNDVVGSPVTATLLTNPTHGTVVLSASGGFDYTPAADATGFDKFTYRTTGANGTDDAEVVISITPVHVGDTTTLSLVAMAPEQQIAATYAAFFGRGADAAGFQFWVGEFQRGLPTQGSSVLSAIANAFGISSEAKGLYPFLAQPQSASDAQIGAFLDSVYDNLFDRASDSAGLGYWTAQVRQTLASGKFVGSVLVDIMSGAQDTAVGKDITTLMGKVAVGLEYVQEQQLLGSTWTAAGDGADAKALLQAVTADPQSVLIGIARAHDLVVADTA